MAFGPSQVSNATPAWVIKAVAAVTLGLQMLTPIVSVSTVLDQHTKEVLDLVVKLVNVGVVVLAVFFGIEKQS